MKRLRELVHHRELKRRKLEQVKHEFQNIQYDVVQELITTGRVDMFNVNWARLNKECEMPKQKR